MLVHFDPKLDLLLACDASAYEVGAVHSHKMPDGSERPIVFVSRSLTKVEKKYVPQIEREDLVHIFGVKNFSHISFWSHHPSHVKRGLVRCLYDRARSITTRQDNLQKEECHLTKVLRQNGYPSNFIRSSSIPSR